MIERLKDLKEYPCHESDSLEPPVGAVLLSDEIERYVKEFRLIDPFIRANLKSAAYELTVGDEYAVEGKIHILSDETGKDTMVIDPFQVVIIKTREIINMPRFLIARWNIKVSLAYEGLLWVGGPQVDPGWVGHLFCPIYNLSNKPVILRLGDPLAVIDFVRTTPFRKNVSVPYSRPPKRVTIEDYHPEQLASASYAQAVNEIKALQRDMGGMSRRLDTLTGHFFTALGLVFAAIAAVVTALSIFVSSGQPEKTYSWWMYVGSGVIVIALALSIYACKLSRSAWKKTGKS